MKKISRDKKNLFEISFELNGQEIDCRVSSTQSILEVIRSLGYKGTKKGCDSGDCGSCTIIMDGKAVVSCIIPAFMADGSKITTIEGVGSVNNPHVIQKAFVEAGAVQCGFCIPGMIMTTKFLLDRIENPDEQTIKHYLDGNICRCSGYIKQIEGVKISAAKIRSLKHHKE